MAENKNSFIIYTDWKIDFEFLTDEEAGKLIKHLLRFASDENPSLENEDRLLQFAAQKMKAVMKKDLKKYEAVIQKRAEAGKKGGVNSGKSRTSKQNEANEANVSTPKQNERDNVNDNVNDNVILLEKETKKENLSKENPNEIFPQSELVEPGEEERKKVAPKKERSEEQLKMPDDFIEIWEEWKEYRKAKRFKSYAGLKWEQMAVDKLLELSDKNPTIAKLILKQTYENSYQGFFPLKQNTNGITNKTNAGFSNNATVSNGKVSGRSIVADRISQHLARNSESGNHTIDIEANIVR